MLTSSDICWQSYSVVSVVTLCVWETIHNSVGSQTAGNELLEDGCCPQHLKRMLLRIQPYDIVIRYKSGKGMTLVDLMSRQPCSNAESLEFDVQISHVQFSTQQLDELRRETRNDNELLRLLKVIADGWPDRQRDLHAQMRAFWPFREELVVHDGIVLKGNQIVMPASLHAETQAKLHASHQGIEKTPPMHSGGSMTSGASITLHQAHITLSQTASLNGTFKP